MLARGKHVKHTTTITNPIGDSGQLSERITLQLWSDGSVTWSERAEINNGRELRNSKPDGPSGGTPVPSVPRPAPMPRPGQQLPAVPRPVRRVLPTSIPKPGPGLRPVAPYPLPGVANDA